MDKRCRSCIFFRSYDFMDNFGYCIKGNVIVDPSNVSVCDNFREVTIEDLKEQIRVHGFVYCATCRKFITSIDELEEHINKHLVTYGFIRDEVAPEEIPTAD